MKKIRIFLILFLLSFSLIPFEATASADEALKVSPSSYNFGDIYQSEGIVSAEIEIENLSDNSIRIFRLSTSCGCTKAEMDLSDLQAKEKRIMKVSFDPNVHKDQTGEIIRMVYLQTSDEANPEIEIEFTGNVIGGDKNTNPISPAVDGSDPPEAGDKEVIVFFNEACQDCGELVNTFYPAYFQKYGHEITRKDYINQRENRTLLNEYNLKWDVPFELQSHIEAFVGNSLLIGGHVPEEIITFLLENPDKYEKLLVYQDEMHGNAKDYKVWDFKGEIKTYAIDEPITTYFAQTHSKQIKSGYSLQKSFWGMFSVVSTSAFLDGINPCAIAVLLFFIAFLFSLKKSKQSIWKMGIVYISAIYLAYLLIGVGLAQAILISGYPHLMAYIGAYLVIGLGIIQLLGILIPNFPIRLRIPINTKPIIENWLVKATLPAAFIGGFIVGLCTFPCSGGIYVAIIGMLSGLDSYWTGFSWMLWYNLIFVMPLIIILILAANPATTERLRILERKQSKISKIIIGLTMILLGAIILLFFIP